MFNIMMASSSRSICFRLVLVAALLFGSACPSHGFLPQTASMRHTTTSTSNTQQRSTKVVPPIHYINGDETSSESLIAVEKDDVVPATTATSSTTSSSSSSSRSCRSYQKPIHTQTNVCSRTGVTLSRYMMEMEKLNPELNEVESIFTSIQVACKAIGKLVKTASLEGHTGVANGGGSMNSHGEEQKTMDVLANDILMKAFQWSGHMRTLCSEEEDAPIDAMIDQEGDYIACFDPLDGSSNVDCGVPVGTIFGIFKAESNNHSRDCRIKATKETNADDNDNDDDDDEGVCLDDALQPGNNLVAAGYCLYSSATTLVFTLGDGVHGKSCRLQH